MSTATKRAKRNGSRVSKRNGSRVSKRNGARKQPVRFRDDSDLVRQLKRPDTRMLEREIVVLPNGKMATGQWQHPERYGFSGIDREFRQRDDEVVIIIRRGVNSTPAQLLGALAWAIPHGFDFGLTDSDQISTDLGRAQRALFSAEDHASAREPEAT